MPSYQISLSAPKRAAGRLIALVRREIQKALAEEHAEHGTTQASIAAALGINRSVVHRQIMGYENLTLGTVGEIANVLGREINFSLTKPVAVDGNHVVVVPTTSQHPPEKSTPLAATTSMVAAFA